MPPGAFEAIISRYGQRVSWSRSHTCPCTFSGGGANGQLPNLGSAQRSCQKCGGIGTYWDPPTLPFKAYISFIQLSPTPDEPGTRMNEKFGPVQLSEPSLTLPYLDPNLAVNDPSQPTTAWVNASTDDLFVPVDAQSRYTAVLQVGTKVSLPYQQNLLVAPQGAVTVWDPATGDVIPVANYAVSGPTVTIAGYPDGTNYMVEFLAAPSYVVWRSAGGLPHIRPFGGGTVNEPRRFKLQLLDIWTRQRGVQQVAPGSARIGGTARPFTTAVGAVVGGGPGVQGS